MAQFDLKKAIIRFVDGKQASATLPASGSVNAKVTFTDKSTHRGTRPAITIAYVIAGISTAFSVVVTDTNIVVNLATDGAGAATSTATAIKAGVDASLAAAALVSTILPGTGAVVPTAFTATALTGGPNFLQIKIAEGMISYDEKKPRIYTLDRGHLYGIKNGDETPMDVKCNSIWEFITASAGSGTPTPEDVLKNRGEAAAWISSDADPCNPFCIDIEIEYNPLCSQPREFIVLEDFRYEDAGHMLKDGILDFSGKCNHPEAFVYRVA